MLFDDPETGSKRRATISYVRNDDVRSSLENRLLLSAEYKPLDRKLQAIAELAYPKLTALSSKQNGEVIGMEFRTKIDGELFWRVFDDLAECSDREDPCTRSEDRILRAL